MFVCLENFVCWDIIEMKMFKPKYYEQEGNENILFQIIWNWKEKNWCRFSSCRLTFTHFRFIPHSMTFWDRAKTERCVNKALWCVARGGAPKLPILYWMLSSQYTYNYNNRKSSHFWAIKIYWQLYMWQRQWKWWLINIANSGLYCSGSTQPLWLYVAD